MSGGSRMQAPVSLHSCVSVQFSCGSVCLAVLRKLGWGTVRGEAL
jgi:hypothetical protein